MDVFLVIIGMVLLLIALVGCVIPVLPGPGLAYLALLVVQLKEAPPFSINFLMVWAIITVSTVALDYLIAPLATKKFGGSKKGIYGSVVGLILGMILFPPIGILIGPLVGAYIGELMSGKRYNDSFRAAVGALVGIATGSLLKVVVVLAMGYYFITNNF